MSLVYRLRYFLAWPNKKNQYHSHLHTIKSAYIHWGKHLSISFVQLPFLFRVSRLMLPRAHHTLEESVNCLSYTELASFPGRLGFFFCFMWKVAKCQDDDSAALLRGKYTCMHKFHCLLVSWLWCWWCATARRLLVNNFFCYLWLAFRPLYHHYQRSELKLNEAAFITNRVHQRQFLLLSWISTYERLLPKSTINLSIKSILWTRAKTHYAFVYFFSWEITAQKESKITKWDWARKYSVVENWVNNFFLNYCANYLHREWRSSFFKNLIWNLWCMMGIQVCSFQVWYVRRKGSKVKLWWIKSMSYSYVDHSIKLQMSALPLESGPRKTACFFFFCTFPNWNPQWSK